MLSRSRFNALSEINDLSFYSEDIDELSRYHGEDKRLDCVYISVPNLQYGDYSGGIHNRSNIEYLKENLESDHWQEKTGYYGHRALVLNATGKYFKQTLEIVSSLEAYSIYCEEHCSELEYSIALDLWLESGHDDFIEAIGEYLISWPKLSKARSWLVWSRICESGELYHYGSGDTLYFDFKRIEKQWFTDWQAKIDAIMVEIFPRFTMSALACPINTGNLPFIQLELAGV
jgi:hypothetical protein